MRTRIIAIMALFSMALAGCSPLNVWNFNSSSNGVEYRYEVVVPMMNYVRITAVTPADQLTGEVVIPSTVNHDGTYYVVTQIGKSAFEGYTGITKITLPSTVSVIEEKAFKGCTALGEINTPQPLSTIEAYAFENCSSLTEFDIQASVSTLGEGCFRHCTALEHIIFPTSLNNIPDKAFEGCTSIDSITIDRTMLSIGAKAFSGCSGVTAFTCLTPTPPAAHANTFEGMNSGIPVTVPMANVSQYQAATGWSYFTNYQGQ